MGNRFVEEAKDWNGKKTDSLLKKEDVEKPFSLGAGDDVTISEVMNEIRKADARRLKELGEMIVFFNRQISRLDSEINERVDKKKEFETSRDKYSSEYEILRRQ